MALENIILDHVRETIKHDEGIKNGLLEVLAENGIFPQKKQIELKKLDGSKVNIPNQHKKFETVLRGISAKVNICLVGPSGSGKTTIVEKVAEVLDLKFYSKSVSLQTGVHEFFGYQDANGKYVKTLFRDAYENGGVFLLDEFDAGNPNVLASLNQATANGSAPFPDGMIKKHDDFIMVMAGNTWGTGGNVEYVGRNKIDAATLDRFMFIEIDYDEELETILCKNKSWASRVQECRKNAREKGVRCVISPRATLMGERLLQAGMSESEVVDALIFKGLSEDERKLIKQDQKFKK